MKRTTTLVGTIVLAVQLQAQLVTLHDTLGNVVNGTHIVHVAPVGPGPDVDPSYSIKRKIYTTLNGDVTKEVNIRRYELDVQAGTMNYFCWGVCYGPQTAGDMPTWLSLPQHAKVLSPGEEVGDFAGYHMPQGLSGNSTYRYVWYDVDAPNDSAWVDIEFQIGAVGIAERTSTTLTAFPNPSAGQDVQVSVANIGDPTGVNLVLYSILGERMRSLPVRGEGARILLATGSLPSGVYFAALERNGKAITTQRVVVTR